MRLSPGIDPATVAMVDNVQHPGSEACGLDCERYFSIRSLKSVWAQGIEPGTLGKPGENLKKPRNNRKNQKIGKIRTIRVFNPPIENHGKEEKL